MNPNVARIMAASSHAKRSRIVVNHNGVFSQRGKKVMSVGSTSSEVLQADSNRSVLSMSHDGNYLATAEAQVNTPGSHIDAVFYKRTNNDFNTIQSATPVSSGSTSSFINDCCWSPDDVHLVLISHNANWAVSAGWYPSVIPYRRDGDVFTLLPIIGTAYGALGCCYSPDGKYLAVGLIGSPYLAIYKVSGDTFTLLPNPSTIPSSEVRALAWDPTSTYLVLVYNSGSNSVIIYKRFGDSFNKLLDPTGTLVPGQDLVAFSPKGDLFVMGLSGQLYAYKRTGDNFAFASTISIGGGITCIGFSKDGRYLTVLSRNSPEGLIVLKRVGDSFVNVGFLAVETDGKTLNFDMYPKAIPGC